MNLVAYYFVGSATNYIEINNQEDLTLSDVVDRVMNEANILTRHIYATIGTQSIREVPLTMKVEDYIRQYDQYVVIRWNPSYMRKVNIEINLPDRSVTYMDITVDRDMILYNLRQYLVKRNNLDTSMKITDSNRGNPANGTTKIGDTILPIIATVTSSDYVVIPVLVRWKNVNDTYDYRLKINSSIRQLIDMIRRHYNISNDYDINVINASQGHHISSHTPEPTTVGDLIDGWVIGIIKLRNSLSNISGIISGDILYNGSNRRISIPFSVPINIDTDTGNDIIDRVMETYPFEYTNGILLIGSGSSIEDLDQPIRNSRVTKDTVLSLIVRSNDSRNREFYQRINVNINNRDQQYRINIRESLSVLVNQLARDYNIDLNRYNIKLRLIDPITNKTTYLYHDKSGLAYNINNGRRILVTVMAIGSEEDVNNPNYSIESHHLGTYYNESDISKNYVYYYDFNDANAKMRRIVARSNSTIPIRRFIEYIGGLLNVNYNELAITDGNYIHQLDQDLTFSSYGENRWRRINSIIYRGIPTSNIFYIPITVGTTTRLFSVDMNQPLIRLSNEIRSTFNMTSNNPIVLAYKTSIINEYKFGREYNLNGLDGIIAATNNDNSIVGRFSIQYNGSITNVDINDELPLAYRLYEFIFNNTDSNEVQFIDNSNSLIDVTKTYRDLNMNNDSVVEVIESTPITNTLVSNPATVNYNNQPHTIDMNRPIREFVDRIRELQGIDGEITIRDNNEVLDKNLPAYIYTSIAVNRNLYGVVEPIKAANSIISINVINLIDEYSGIYEVNIDDTIGAILNNGSAVMINNGVILDNSRTARYYRLDNIGTIYIAQ